MQILQCPGSYDGPDPLLFLAGGISGCPDWQEEMISMVRNANMSKEVVLVNPRRVGFDITNSGMSEEQIVWEHHYLELSAGVSFWFPKETLCPITLFELGKVAAQGKKIYVGCHPDYPRVFDVKKQLQLLRPDVLVHSDLQSLVSTIIGHINVGFLFD